MALQAVYPASDDWGVATPAGTNGLQSKSAPTVAPIAPSEAGSPEPVQAPVPDEVSEATGARSEEITEVLLDIVDLGGRNLSEIVPTEDWVSREGLHVSQAIAEEHKRNDRGHLASYTSAGKKGKNEDAIVLAENKDGQVVLAVVVDAMGGGSNGQEAAKAVSHPLTKEVPASEEGLKAELRKSCWSMKEDIFEINFDPQMDGAVMAMARDHDEWLELLYVGDPEIFIVDLTEQELVYRSMPQDTYEEFRQAIRDGDIKVALDELDYIQFFDPQLKAEVQTQLEQMKTIDRISQALLLAKVTRDKVFSSSISSSISSRGDTDLPPVHKLFRKKAGHTYRVLLMSDGVSKVMTDEELIDRALQSSKPAECVQGIENEVDHRQAQNGARIDHHTALAFDTRKRDKGSNPGTAPA